MPARRELSNCQGTRHEIAFLHLKTAPPLLDGRISLRPKNKGQARATVPDL